MFGRLYPRNDEERQAALDAGYDLDRVLTSDDLVSGEDVFFSATGISDGDLLKGVRYWGNGASTQSHGDAFEVGHHPHHRRHPQVAEADEVLRVQVRLNNESNTF